MEMRWFECFDWYRWCLELCDPAGSASVGVVKGRAFREARPVSHRISKNAGKVTGENESLDCSDPAPLSFLATRRRETPPQASSRAPLKSDAGSSQSRDFVAVLDTRANRYPTLKTEI